MFYSAKDDDVGGGGSGDDDDCDNDCVSPSYMICNIH
jgi:hypothetical protein